MRRCAAGIRDISRLLPWCQLAVSTAELHQSTRTADYTHSLQKVGLSRHDLRGKKSGQSCPQPTFLRTDSGRSCGEHGRRSGGGMYCCCSDNRTAAPVVLPNPVTHTYMFVLLYFSALVMAVPSWLPFSPPMCRGYLCPMYGTAERRWRTWYDSCIVLVHEAVYIATTSSCAVQAHAPPQLSKGVDWGQE